MCTSVPPWTRPLDQVLIGPARRTGPILHPPEGLPWAEEGVQRNTLTPADSQMDTDAVREGRSLTHEEEPSAPWSSGQMEVLQCSEMIAGVLRLHDGSSFPFPV
ncbi:unnamed protein product [Lota lota]